MYAPYIDGLRAVAVIAVVLYHLDASWLPGGFAGVDVFFVISGFVVSSSVSGLTSIRLRELMLYFYARRLARIMPALVVCLLITFLASALFIPNSWLSRSNAPTGLLAFVGLSNFELAKAGNNYFSPTTEFNPFTHTWSLAIEEQFYLVFPLLFSLWLRSRRGVSIALFATLSIASFGVAIWLAHTDQTRAFYMPWSRFWELGAGVLLFQLMVARGHSFSAPGPVNRLATHGALVSFLLLALGLVMATSTAAPYPACVLPVLGCLGVLGCLHGNSSGPVNRLLTLGAVRFIGKISYSLYLWHWPVFVLFRWTLGLDTPVLKAASAIIAFGLATLSYYFVEGPPRALSNRMPRLVTIAAGLLVIFVAWSTARYIDQQEPVLSLSTFHANSGLVPGPLANQVSAIPGCQVTTSMASAGGGTIWVYSRDHCSAPVTFRNRVFVVGDSHAMAYTPMMTQFSLETGAEVHVYGNGGCPFISLRPRASDPNAQCAEFGLSAIADIVQRVQPGDIIFLASLRLPRMVDQWAHFHNADAIVSMIHSAPEEEARRAGEDTAIKLLGDLTQKGAKVVFEAPTPMFDTVPFRCSDWFNRTNPICAHADMPREILESMRAPVLDSYRNIAHSVPGVSVWDPLPVLCSGTACKTTAGTGILFYDGDHITPYANGLLLPHFSSYLNQLVKPAS